MQSTIQSGMKVISQDQVMMLNTGGLELGTSYRKFILLLVEFKRQEHELQNVDSTEELQLECPVVADTPHTDGDTEDADNQSEVSIVAACLELDQSAASIAYSWTNERLVLRLELQTIIRRCFHNHGEDPY